MNLSLCCSASLRAKIELALPLLFFSGDALYIGEDAGERYREYLLMLHGTVRASVPLMKTALKMVEGSCLNDRVAYQLADYLIQHIKEETGHDTWLLEDLASLGVTAEYALRRAPAPSIAALVGSQYYWILHHDPVALLGYIAVMEGYPPTIQRIDDLMSRTGLTPEGFRSLRKHALLDPHHRDELNALLDRMPLTLEQQALIGTSALHTAFSAAEALREVSVMQLKIFPGHADDGRNYAQSYAG